MKKVVTNAGNLEVQIPSFRHNLEAIYGSFSANFARKDIFRGLYISLYLMRLQIAKTKAKIQYRFCP